MASSSNASVPFARISPALRKKLATVKMLLLDVDGILTDATVFITETSEIKQFHIQDGLGQILLQKSGIKVGWISNRPSIVTEKRARELKVDFLFQGKSSKVAAAEQILAQAGLTFADVCYAGDDVVDLGLLKRAGVAITVPDAVYEARQVADYVTTRQGGKGAVREIVELILRTQKKWQATVDSYVEL